LVAPHLSSHFDKRLFGLVEGEELKSDEVENFEGRRLMIVDD